MVPNNRQRERAWRKLSSEEQNATIVDEDSENDKSRDAEESFDETMKVEHKVEHCAA